MGCFADRPRQKPIYDGLKTVETAKVASTSPLMPRVLPSHIVQATNHLFGPRNEI